MRALETHAARVESCGSGLVRHCQIAGSDFRLRRSGFVSTRQIQRFEQRFTAVLPEILGTTTLVISSSKSDTEFYHAAVACPSQLLAMPILVLADVQADLVKRAHIRDHFRRPLSKL